MSPQEALVSLSVQCEEWALGIRKVWVQILALPQPSCVTLGKSLNFSGPQFPPAIKWDCSGATVRIK